MQCNYQCEKNRRESMKRVVFPLREEQSWLVKYTVKNEQFGMYVPAVDKDSAIWKVKKRVKGSYNHVAESGRPGDRNWEEE